MSWLSSFRFLLRDERVILAGIGLATFGIVSTMTAALTILRDENIVPIQLPKTRYITQDTEDSLGLDTLERLLEYPGSTVRDVATRILCERAVNNREVIRYLLHGITRPDYDERMKALRALVLLTGQATDFDGLANLNNKYAYRAFVRSIELSLGDAERPKLNDHHWDEYYLRDVSERLCLMFILELVNKYDAQKIIRAGFVDKWLAKQDWGDSLKERQYNFAEYMRFKNNRIVDIVTRIRCCNQGLHALALASLIPGSEVIGFGRPVVVDMSIPAPEQQVPRAREQSVEEVRLRRQHREAMVLNDGTRPFGREDIIERDQSSPD
ncbi:unnamed protein product [Clonostachys byssicola]|uniref:Cytoskeleton-associated protein n=1 Tax=Clonostachys byssicola TaxID=160290 RepID=A0A9N9XU61_9HYPO|nr:unnamed protein product [Clonostachys byssicola]